MAKRRTSKPAIEIRDREHCDAVLRDMCTATAQLQAAEGMLNDELTRVRERYESAIAAARGQVKELTAAVEAFAIKHRSEFGQAKTLTLLHGKLQFRVTPPAVRQLNRKWSWDSILATVEMAGERLAAWVRTKHELNKDQVLADYAAETVDDTDLAGFGLRVVQTEQFAVDLNLDAVAE